MTKIKTTIICTMVLLTSSLVAQELSLSDCVNIALNNKETLASAQLDVESAKAGKRGALSNILPSIYLNGGRNETDFAQSGISNNAISWSAGLSGRQNLYDGGGWWNRIAKAKNTHGISQQLERQVLTNVIVDVHSAFFQVLKLEQLVEVARQNLELTEQQVELAQKRFDLGAAKKTDLLKSEVARGIAKAALIGQESNFGTALANLRNAMGLIGENRELMLSEKLIALESFPELEQAIEILKVNNPGVLATEGQLKDAKVNLKLARALRLPSLDFTASYSTSSPTFDGLTDAVQEKWTFSNNLNLSVPIFNGFALSTGTQQAKIAIKKQENDLTTVTNDAIVQLDNFLGNVNDYFELIPINEEVLASAEEDLKLVSERYRLGSASILELLDAQVSVTQARVDLVSTKYDARIQQAYLKAQLGILDKDYYNN